MTSSVRTGSSSRNGSMVSRSLETVWLSPSTLSGPTRRRISSNARGQSSSAPSSSPIRWSLIHDLDSNPLVVLALALGARDAYAANLRRRQDVRAAVGLPVQPDDVDDPERVDLLRDQVGRGADQRRVAVGDAAGQEVDDDLVRLGDLLVDPAFDRRAEVGRPPCRGREREV